MSEERDEESKARDRALQLSEWAHLMWKVLPLETAIDQVRARFQGGTDEDRATLFFHLQVHLSKARRYDELLRLVDEMIARNPDDVVFLLSKARVYSFYLDAPEEALKWIDVALARAYRTGAWVRDALGDKARLLVDLRRGEELGQVLEQIMSHKVQRDLPDIGRERDFVDRAPPGLIAADILARYDSFCPKRGGDTPHEPPEFDEPEFGPDGEEISVTRDR